MDIYAEEVMEHYEHPRNQGELEGTDVQTARDSNASCGDMIEFFVRVQKVPNTQGGASLPAGRQGSELIITEVKWKGIGCAISTAAASKLSQYLQGRTLKDVYKMGEKDLVKQIGFTVNPGREKCLTLPARVVKKLLDAHTTKT